MENINFTITSEDVEALEKTNPDFCLTDDNAPLSLLCTAYGEYSENEAREASRDYTSENESYILDNLEYETVFLQEMKPADRVKYAQDLKAYDEAFEIFKETERDNLRDWNATFETLQTEYTKAQDDFYDQFKREYLYGDWRNDGILHVIQKHLPYGVEMEYEKATGNITISEDTSEYLEAEEINGRADKNDFLQSMKYRAIEKIKERKEKAKKRREEREKEKERKATREAQAIKNKQEKILSFNK